MTQTDSPYGQTLTISDAKFRSFSNSKKPEDMAKIHRNGLRKLRLLTRLVRIKCEVIGIFLAASIGVPWGTHSLIKDNIYGG